jgi:hypothetical protein
MLQAIESFLCWLRTGHSDIIRNRDGRYFVECTGCLRQSHGVVARLSR